MRVAVPAGLDTPVLVIDRPILMANIEHMAAAMGRHDVALRPHFKTSKMLEVAELQMSAGAVGFTCATQAEVEALLDAGMTDVFWAHAPATATKARFAAEANRSSRVAVGIDNVHVAALVNAAASEAGVAVPVMLEVDTGLHRTGVSPAQATDLATAIAAMTHLRLDGVYTHEGQLASMSANRQSIVDAGTAAALELVAVAKRLREDGHAIRVVSVGSTPGWDSAPFVPGVTEARPGTYVFYDANQWRLGSADLSQCALTVLSTVVGAPRFGDVVIDAGIKTMSSDRSNRDASLGQVLTGDAASIADAQFVRAYEEHGIVEGPAVADLNVGDAVRILPNHACGVVNMHSRVAVVEGGVAVDEWATMARH